MTFRECVQLIIPLIVILSAIVSSGCIEEEVKRTDWAYQITQLDGMNSQGYTGKGIIIGIVDTGVDLGHPDLKHINIIAWKDLINERTEPYDDEGHGTHVTGIIAANGTLKGGAPDVSLIIVKAIDKNGKGSDSGVADAIDFCVSQGADIISLSLGAKARFLNLGDNTARATQNAVNRGVFVVAAAGNDGENDDGEVESPGNEKGAISVGAVDKELRIAEFSSKGHNDGFISGFPDPGDRHDPNKKPEVVAPGVDITSTYKGEKYAKASGTSQATPFVAAGLALILQAHPEYKRTGSEGGSIYAVEKVKDAMMKGAYKCPGQDTPHDDHYGYGLFQAKATSDNL